MGSNPSALKTVAPSQYTLAPQPVVSGNTICISLMIAFSVVFCAIAAYQKHRATVRQQQINLLNRLWQLDSSRKLS